MQLFLPKLPRPVYCVAALRQKMTVVTRLIVFVTLCACTDDILIHDAATDTSDSDSTTMQSSDSGNGDTSSEAQCTPSTTPADGAPEVDIVMAVDNSAGMEDEIAMVQGELTTFLGGMESIGINVHLTLITAPSPSTDDKVKNGICTPAPVGSGDCPEDTQLPLYQHIPQTVASKDALSVIQTTYDQWQPRIRPAAQLHFIVVSDDNADVSAEVFTAALGTATTPLSDFYFHTISASEDKAAACADTASSLCCDYAAKKGIVYQELAAQTGGVAIDLCVQDFTTAFTEIADRIISLRCAATGTVS